MQGLRKFFLFLLFAATQASQAVESPVAFYPINFRMFALERNDGSVVKFVRDETEPRALIGVDGWQGQTENGDSLLLRQNGDGQPVEGFQFKQYEPVLELLNGRERRITGSRLRGRSFDELWPRRLTDEEISENSIWSHDGRMKFGFVNPNYAAAFLGMMCILFLSLGWGGHCRLFSALSILVSLAFAGGLALTGSRGGMLALIASVSVYILFKMKRFVTWKRVGAAMLVVVICLTAMCLFHVGDRYTRTMFKLDASNLGRLELWSAAPRMIVDAPQGWGWGQSGIAYTNWYEKQDQEKMVGGMINSHLTLLVEGGWAFRFFYLFVWFWFFMTALRDARYGRSVFPVAVGVFLAIAAFFNSVMVSGLTWPIPCLAVACLLLNRIKGHTPFWCKTDCIVSLVLTIVGVGTIAATGYLSPPPQVHVRGRPGAVVVGKGTPQTWYVDDGQVLDGGYLGCVGREVREKLSNSANKCVGIACSFGAVPREAQRIVLFGKRCADFLQAWRSGQCAALPKEVVFVSPAFGPDEIPQSLEQTGRLQVNYGSLALQATGTHVRNQPWLKVRPGVMLYFPNWLNF